MHIPQLPPRQSWILAIIFASVDAAIFTYAHSGRASDQLAPWLVGAWIIAKIGGAMVVILRGPPKE